MKPYIITDETTNQEIAEMINRAYDEGYKDGFEEGKKQGITITCPDPITKPYITWSNNTNSPYYVGPDDGFNPYKITCETGPYENKSTLKYKTTANTTADLPKTKIEF